MWLPELLRVGMCVMNGIQHWNRPVAPSSRACSSPSVRSGAGARRVLRPALPMVFPSFRAAT